MITIPGKIPISIRPLFWLIGFFIGWMWTTTLIGAFLALFVIFFSVLFHEFGHAMTAIFFGQTTRIELAAFGGFTYRTGRKLRLWEEFLVVLNGPLAGLLLAIGAYIVYQYTMPTVPNVRFILQFTYVANLFWTIMNLVPVLPLDGGHLLSIILESIFGFKGVKAAVIVGIIVAVTISILFFIIGQFLVGALFLILTFESFRSLRYYKMFNEKDRDQDVQALLKEADQHRDAGALDRASSYYEKVRDTTKKGILYTMATQELAQIYKNKGEIEKAYQLLLPIQKDISSEYLPLFHFLSFKSGDMKTTIKLGNECYQINPTYDTALINACANGALGKVEAAIGWLECCIREQIPSIQEVVFRHEFDTIRDDKRFQKFIQKVMQ